MDSADRIVIRGNRAISERQIKAAMVTRERRFWVRAGTVQRKQLDQDVERILALYHDHGYLQARVEPPEPDVDYARGRVTVIVDIVEGSQDRVGQIRIAGARVLPESEVRRQLKLRPGDVFSRSRLRDSLERIADLYRSPLNRKRRWRETASYAPSSAGAVTRSRPPCARGQPARSPGRLPPGPR